MKYLSLLWKRPRRGSHTLNRCTWIIVFGLASILSAPPPSTATTRDDFRTVSSCVKVPVAWMIALRPLRQPLEECLVATRVCFGPGRPIWIRMQDQANDPERQRRVQPTRVKYFAGRAESKSGQNDALFANKTRRTANVDSQRMVQGKPRFNKGKQTMSTGRSKIPLMSCYTDAGKLMDDMQPFLVFEADASTSGLPRITAQDDATLMNRLKQLGAAKSGGEK